MRGSVKSARDVDLSEFDLQPLEELDPSSNGIVQKAIFDGEIDFRIHFIEPNGDTETLEKPEKIRVRMFCCESKDGEDFVRIELTSDNDIFFYYYSIIDRKTFQYTKEKQKLNCEFLEYPMFCKELFDNLQEKSTSLWAEYSIHHDGTARLIIMKEISLKRFNVLLIDFDPMDTQRVKENITYRSGSMKSQIKLMEARLVDIYKVLKKTNPSLLLLLSKNLK